MLRAPLPGSPPLALSKGRGHRRLREVGQYWSKANQIDVIGLRDDGWTDLGECKWGTVRSRLAVEQELEAKIREYPNSRNSTIGRRIFTRGKPPADTQRAAGARWHGLDDLYA